MKTVLFRREADADLRAIVDWYGQEAPASVDAILADIYRSLDLLIDFPFSGPKVGNLSFRRIVTHKYHFKIAYQVDDKAIIVLGIYRYQNREQ